MNENRGRRTDMWNAKLFRTAISNITAHGDSLNQRAMKSKEELYAYLGENVVHASHHTVKSWTRENSRGPSDPAIVKALEHWLGGFTGI